MHINVISIVLICIAKEVHLDTITSWFRKLVDFKFTFPVISYKPFVNANSARWHIQKVSSFLQVLYQESNRYVLLIEWNGAFSSGISSMSPGPVIKSENIINPENINSYIYIYTCICKQYCLHKAHTSAHSLIPHYSIYI